MKVLDLSCKMYFSPMAMQRGKYYLYLLRIIVCPGLPLVNVVG